MYIELIPDELLLTIPQSVADSNVLDPLNIAFEDLIGA